MARHPGTIVFVDGKTNTVKRTVDANRMSRALRFAPTPAGEEAVVRIVETVHDRVVYLQEYGEGGKLLRTRTLI